MSNRQERKARKERQRNGEEAFAHIKPTRRSLPPIPLIQGQPARNEIRRRAARYGIKPERRGFDFVESTPDAPSAVSPTTAQQGAESFQFENRTA